MQSQGQSRVDGVGRKISTQVRGVEGGVDSIMGLSTTTLAAQLEDVVAARRAG